MPGTREREQFSNALPASRAACTQDGGPPITGEPVARTLSRPKTSRTRLVPLRSSSHTTRQDESHVVVLRRRTGVSIGARHDAPNQIVERLVARGRDRSNQLLFSPLLHL